MSFNITLKMAHNSFDILLIYRSLFRLCFSFDEDLLDEAMTLLQCLDQLSVVRALEDALQALLHLIGHVKLKHKTKKGQNVFLSREKVGILTPPQT